MSWLLENWFGGKESLEQVREEIKDYAQKEVYLGVSGLENPEQSSNRVPPQELFLALHGPWEKKLEENEAEFLQFVHDELPPVVRDEVGIISFFAAPTTQGYLVLTFIRNAGKRDVAFYKLPLSLVNARGEVMAKKNFDMMKFGTVGDRTSRAADFLFRWEEFRQIPEQGEPLFLRFDAPLRKKTTTAVGPTDTMDPKALAHYEERSAEQQMSVVPGEVKLDALDILPADEGNWKVVVLFRNGLDKRLEFTEVPIQIRDQQGAEVATIRFGLKNLRVDPNSSLIWGFDIPAESINKPGVNPAECTAYIPDPEPKKSLRTKRRSRGMIQ
ncbi:SLAP domain-containing protein [Brevibacillus humidisoli]|uniref:SLAP domain-containing protein n=1 Tax=Brevibacillus humidisoli TaxID=2895522 RepID=UPI001E3C620F|nr:SLAP domain-containing protein [Brevibacillus humidisoli]UFJ40073.1 SLAP domain-containing protein [Brevibacillus humidisoli]